MTGLVNKLLSKRLKKNETPSKMAALAKKSASGDLNGLTGMLAGAELNDGERNSLRYILERYANDNEESLETDLQSLTAVTSEIKAINHQAALLHGERIKKAHDILLPYMEGAFTAWLMATYNNRQTPYNFLQYFLFYQETPQDLRPQLESMPRQAIYTLASRSGDMSQKQDIVKSYSGESKQELIEKIRDTFPLPEQDQRREDTGVVTINALKKLLQTLSRPQSRISCGQRETIKELMAQIEELINV